MLFILFATRDFGPYIYHIRSIRPNHELEAWEIHATSICLLSADFNCPLYSLNREIPTQETLTLTTSVRIIYDFTSKSEKALERSFRR